MYEFKKPRITVEWNSGKIYLLISFGTSLKIAEFIFNSYSEEISIESQDLISFTFYSAGISRKQNTSLLCGVVIFWLTTPVA